MKQVYGRLKVVECVCITGVEMSYSTKRIRKEMQWKIYKSDLQQYTLHIISLEHYVPTSDLIVSLK